MEFKIDKKTLKRIIIGVIICIVAYWVLNDFVGVKSVFNSVIGVMSPFIVGMVFAFIVNVPMRTFERWMHKVKNAKLKRGLALTCAYVLVLAIISGVLGLLIPELISTIRYDLIPEVQTFFGDTQVAINKWLSENPEMMEYIGRYIDPSKLNLSSLVQELLTWVSNSLGKILTVTVSAVKDTALFVMDAFFAIVFLPISCCRKNCLPVRVAGCYMPSARKDLQISPYEFCVFPIRPSPISSPASALRSAFLAVCLPFQWQSLVCPLFR